MSAAAQALIQATVGVMPLPWLLLLLLLLLQPPGRLQIEHSGSANACLVRFLGGQMKLQLGLLC